MVEIYYSAEFNKDFVKLKQRTENGNSEARYLLELIQKANSKLSENREAGIKIPKKLWPKEYVQKHDVKNLWKYNLDPFWRLVYTIQGNEINLHLIYLMSDAKHSLY